MSHYFGNENKTSIDILNTEDSGGYTSYNIQVTVGMKQWHLKHRYREFCAFHKTLVANHGVSQGLLPTRKTLNTKSTELVQSRKKILDAYCKKLMTYFGRSIPPEFAEFFLFNEYEVYYRLPRLALEINRCRIMEQTAPTLELPLIEVYSITEFLRRPRPQVEETDPLRDTTIIFELCKKVSHLRVNGNRGAYKDSNIIPQELPISFSPFKEVKALTLNDIGMSQIESLGYLRSSVQKLRVCNTLMKRFQEILLGDIVHKSSFDPAQHCWPELTHIDFSRNCLTDIDDSISLVPKLKELIVDQNVISSLPNLSSLHCLENISMVNNSLLSVDMFGSKLGSKVRTLVLSRNNIESLEGLEGLQSLVTLDLSYNKISSIQQVRHLSTLENLSKVTLQGNNIATFVDYRITVLKFFKDRAQHICLDNENTTQSELDKVEVFRALESVKKGETPDFNSKFFHSSKIMKKLST